MATSFDRWEKDPFFAAAEEVQESSDRMESVYRRWIQEQKIAPNPYESSDLAVVELSRELHTALGTAKWQLEELERAINSNDESFSVGEDTRVRHSQFVSAIRSRITMVENSLKESNFQKGETQLTWVRLDEEERDELALFLACPLQQKGRVDFSKDSAESTGSSSSETRQSQSLGQHRRVASAGADIGSWKIMIPSEGEDTSERSSDDQPNPNPNPILPLPKIHSLSSGLNGALETKSRVKFYRNGFRKGKGGYKHDIEESIPLRNAQLSQGIDECYERSKSCLSNCGEETYEKELNGWVGALHRQIQRSHYQIQYGRPLQVFGLTILAVLLIFMFVWSTGW